MQRVGRLHVDTTRWNDFERAAKIAKISKIAKSTERPINTEGTKELDEFWGSLFVPRPVVQRRESAGTGTVMAVSVVNSDSLGAIGKPQNSDRLPWCILR